MHKILTQRCREKCAEFQRRDNSFFELMNELQIFSASLRLCVSALKFRAFCLAFLLTCFSMHSLWGTPQVTLGCDRLFEKEFLPLMAHKRLGLITNPSGVNSHLVSTLDVLKSNAANHKYTLAALFAPEHGIKGELLGEEQFKDTIDSDGVPIYSLHGKTFRPSPEMLKDIDVLIFDIQDIGSRSYTFSTTLFYVMEEAAKHNISVIVLDRPNPINGVTVDGPILRKEFQSIVGYLEIPYCHGMTLGELAQYFNGEYAIGCKLAIVPMQGWKRTMTFSDTGLQWIPTSPHIPEATTALYYPITGILGELSIVNIGVGYTTPFQMVGAPWIDADKFAEALNKQKFPGVTFVPWHYKPFYGRYAHEVCHGVLVRVEDPLKYLPVSTQYLLLGVLKNLYGDTFAKSLVESKNRHAMFNKINGTEEVLTYLLQEKHIIWPLRGLHTEEKKNFMKKRAKYLIYPPS